MKTQEKFRHPVIVALLFAIIMILLCFTINRFQFFYSTNDDYYISQFLVEGEDKSLFLNYFFSYPLMQLYAINSRVNWFVIIQIILNFFAIFCLNYIFIKKFIKGISTAIILGYSILFINQFVSIIQYSQTSIILITTGFICICSVFLWNIVSARVPLLAIACLFSIVGTSIRFFSLFPACLIIGIYVISYGLSIILKKKEHHRSFYTLRKVIHAFVSIIIISSVCFAINGLSNVILNNDNSFSSYQIYNSYRSECRDYVIPAYSGNEKSYESLGITSQNDLDVLHGFTTDTTFFNTERIKNISDFSNTKWYGKRFFFSYMWNRLSALMNGWRFILVLIVLLIFLSIVLLLVKFRNKVKYVFPILLVTIFIPYFFLFRLNYIFILALPILFIVLVTGFTFNRYHFLQMSLVVISCMALVFYMNFVRLNFRVAFNIFFPTIIVLFGMLDCNNLTYKFLEHSNNQIIEYISCILFFCICVFSTVLICKSEAITINERTEISDYIEKNSKTLFVDEGAEIGLCNYNSPLLSPSERPNNLVPFGWYVNSPSFCKKLKSFHINNLFSEMVNNSRIKLLLRKNESLEKYETYFKAHYSVNCKLLVDDEFEDVYVISVVEKNIKRILSLKRY